MGDDHDVARNRRRLTGRMHRCRSGRLIDGQQVRGEERGQFDRHAGRGGESLA